MATASVFPIPFAITTTPPLLPMRPEPQREPRRRQPAPMQGMALSVLGHAIEYLIDARLVEGGTDRNDNEAVRIMMACSRAVFEECALTSSLRKPIAARLGQCGQWITHRLRAGNA